MDNRSKASFLYVQAARYGESGNPLASKQMEKLADHFGSLYVKESLSKAKKEKIKRAYMDKPIKISMPHSGLKKKALQNKTANWRKTLASNYNTLLTAGQGFNKAQGIAPSIVRNVGKGAAIAAVPLAGAAYVAPKIMKDTAESTTEGIMGKVKEYAVPAALLLAGAGTAAYGAYSNKDSIANKLRNGSAGFVPPARSKVSFIIQGVKFREKLASQFGENSEEASMCDKALSRLLFKE